MKEFVFGSDKQYDILKKSLNDGLCHVYECVFPPRFSRRSGRLGFEKDDVSYILYIDKGMRCSGKPPQLLKSWLEEGSLRFLDYSDMKSFVKGCAFLYGENQRGESGENE